MAAEVNGVYGAQYTQPAELAASTPSMPSHAPSHSIASSTPSMPVNKPDPREVGWFFVEQYYTTLSKSPEKIHLFYNKKSQLVHGVEAEKVMPSNGGKAISEKISSLDIQDCKVRVLNVDSQASFHNIVVQVIGEISNKLQPHNKFVQTFVLAEQPNGYFVLNDIFRYLNNDEHEIVEDEVEPEQAAQEEPMPVETTAPKEPESTPQPAAEEIDTKPEDDEEEHSLGKDSTPPPEIDESQDLSTSTIPEDNVEQSTTGDTQTPPADEEPAAPEPTPDQSPPTIESPESALEEQPTKKTWASMVGAKASSVAVPALPVAPTAPSNRPLRTSQPTAAPKTPPEPSATISSNPTSPTESNGWQNVDSNKRQTRPPGKMNPEQVTLAYIKNVNEKVDARILRDVLEKYGELKYFDVSRQRNCAFVEFSEPGSYAAAVANNPHDIGGEVIIVEERKPRPGAYGGNGAGFARGRGAPTQFAPRGSDASRGRGMTGQGRGGGTASVPKDTARGGFSTRGSRTGTTTPRGRGQAQDV